MNELKQRAKDSDACLLGKWLHNSGKFARPEWSCVVYEHQLLHTTVSHILGIAEQDSARAEQILLSGGVQHMSEQLIKTLLTLSSPQDFFQDVSNVQTKNESCKITK